MNNENFQQYKPAKTILEQLDYLNKNINKYKDTGGGNKWLMIIILNTK